MPRVLEWKAFTNGFRDEIVTIIANPDSPEQQTFAVSKVLICLHSDYFERALNSDFKESHSRVVELRDINTECLKAIIYWVYCQKLPHYDSEYHEIDDAGPGHLARLWVIANKLVMPFLQNRIMRELCAVLQDECLEVETIVEIYRSTIPGSPLRKLACYEVASSALMVHAKEERRLQLEQCFEKLENFGIDVYDANHTIMLGTDARRVTRAEVLEESEFRVE